MNIENVNHQHRIRSFVKRAGRITPGQERALKELLPLYNVDNYDGVLEFDEIYTRSADTILEIGFGMGQSLLAQAAANPENNYLGIEVHSPGVGSLLKGMNEQNIENIRVSLTDAVEMLNQKIPEQSLSTVQLFFPDPWHKKKHHKRRIVNHAFAEKILTRLKPGGLFHLATDWQIYAEHMLETLSEIQAFENVSDDNTFVPRPDSRPLTKFEKRGQKLGHGIWDLMFIKNEK